MVMLYGRYAKSSLQRRDTHPVDTEELRMAPSGERLRTGELPCGFDFDLRAKHVSSFRLKENAWLTFGYWR
jgi:hypothetical protein